MRIVVYLLLSLSFTGLFSMEEESATLQKAEAWKAFFSGSNFRIYKRQMRSVETLGFLVTFLKKEGKPFQLIVFSGRENERIEIDDRSYSLNLFLGPLPLLDLKTAKK